MLSNFEQALLKKGWQILPGSLEDCFDGEVSEAAITLDDLSDKLLNLDLNKFGSASNSENPDTGTSAPARVKADVVSGPLVLQIQRVRNVSAPKANETSHGAPQLLKVTVTDGSATYYILQIGSWNSVSLDTPPGTKLMLKNGQSCRVHCGFLPLKQNQFTILGGTVPPLVEKWELTKVFGLHTRNRQTGAPKWVPFGHKISKDQPIIPPGQFKSLESEAKVVKENEAFDQQRQANIEELAKSFDVKKKTFGKGKVTQSDQQSFEGKFQNNQGRFGNQSRGGFPGRGRGDRSTDEGRPRFERRNNSRRDEREDSDSHSMPSKPTTLFDFLTNKLADPEVSNDGTLSAINNATQVEFKSYADKKPDDRQDHHGYDGNRRGRHSGHFSRGGPRNHSDTGRSHSDYDNYNNYNHQNKFSGQSRQTSRGNQQFDYQSSRQGHHQGPSGREQNFQHSLQAGDKVLAKYWEDQKMHRAIISQIFEAGNTCVIQFVDYDNYEEVFLKDVQPCLTHVWESFRPGGALTGAESVGAQNRTDQPRRYQETFDHTGGERGATRYGQRGRGREHQRSAGPRRSSRGDRGPRPDFEDSDQQFSGTFEFRRRGQGYAQGGGRRGSTPPPTREEPHQRRPHRGERPERQLYRPPGQRRSQGPPF